MVQVETKTSILVDNLSFPESPRWHEGKLWFSNVFLGRTMHGQVMHVALQGDVRTVIELPDAPSGLGWTPDGRLLIVSAQARRLLRLDGQGLVEVADQDGSSPRRGKQYSLQKAAGETAVLYVSSVCNAADPTAVFRELDLYHDIGLDAEIELLDHDRTTTGAIAYVQIKSYEDPSKQHGAYSFTADTSNYVSWSRYPFPVIGIVYSQRDDMAMWVDVSAYIKANPEIVDTNQDSTTIEARVPFDNPHFDEFSKYILERYRVLFLDQAVEAYYTLDSQGRAAHLNVLFASYKDSHLFSIFLRHVFWEAIDDIAILTTCLRCMSYYSNGASRPELRTPAFDLFLDLTYTDILAILSAKLIITKHRSYWDDPYFEAAAFINEGMGFVPDCAEFLDQIYSDEAANRWARLRAGQFLQLDPYDPNFRDLLIEALETMDASGDEPEGLASRAAQLVSNLYTNTAEAIDFLRDILEDDEIAIDTRRNAAGALAELGGARDEVLYRKLNLALRDCLER